MSETREILNATQAMEYLQVCRNTFYKLMKTGEIPHTKLGTQLRFSRRQLRAMIEGEVQTHRLRDKGQPIAPIDTISTTDRIPAPPVQPQAAKRKPGRLAPAERQRAQDAAIAALSAGGSKRDAAAAAGVTMRSLQRWCETTPEFKARVDQAGE